MRSRTDHTVNAGTGATNMRQDLPRLAALISVLGTAWFSGCAYETSSPPLPGIKTAASTASPSSSKASTELAPQAVSIETPLVVDVVEVFNKARQEGGRPVLKVSSALQEIAKAQVKALVSSRSEPGRGMAKAAAKKARVPALSVSERAEKLGYRYQNLKEITFLASGPAPKALSIYLKDPKSEFHQAAFGDCTEFAVAEGRDGMGLPHLSLIFGTPEPGQGDTKAAPATPREESNAGKPSEAPAAPSPKASPETPKGTP